MYNLYNYIIYISTVSCAITYDVCTRQVFYISHISGWFIIRKQFVVARSNQGILVVSCKSVLYIFCSQLTK